jgi:hypothetical protein
MPGDDFFQTIVMVLLAAACIFSLLCVLWMLRICIKYWATSSKTDGNERGEVEKLAEAPAEVVEALQAGNKIQAVKLYRQATGKSLAEAKAAVDDLEHMLGLG